MAVYQQDTGKLYILTANPNTDVTTASDWTEFTGGSGAGDLQSVLEGGSQFVKPNGYGGGVLSINYSGTTGNPSDPSVNSTGLLIDGNSTGTNTGENLVIAASGNADAGFIKLHAQGTNAFPTVDYTRLEILENNLIIDTNSGPFANAAGGDAITIKAVQTGVGTNGKKCIIGRQPLVRTTPGINLNTVAIANLHTTPTNIFVPNFNLYTNKYLQIIKINVFTFIEFTNSESLEFYMDGCSTLGAPTSNRGIMYVVPNATTNPINTGLSGTTTVGYQATFENVSNCTSIAVRLTGPAGPIVNGPTSGNAMTIYITYQIFDI